MVYARMTSDWTAIDDVINRDYCQAYGIVHLYTIMWLVAVATIVMMTITVNIPYITTLVPRRLHRCPRYNGINTTTLYWPPCICKFHKLLVLQCVRIVFKTSVPTSQETGWFFTIKDQLVNSVREIVAIYSMNILSMEVNCMEKNSQTLMLTDVVLNYWVLDCFQGNFG